MGLLERARANTRHPDVIARNVMAKNVVVNNVMAKPSERPFAGVRAATGERRQCVT